jgi:hypothetical protein
VLTQSVVPLLELRKIEPKQIFVIFCVLSHLKVIAPPTTPGNQFAPYLSSEDHYVQRTYSPKFTPFLLLDSVNHAVKVCHGGVFFIFASFDLSLSPAMGS